MSMNEWLSPTGISTILALVALVVSLVQNVRQKWKQGRTEELVTTFSQVATTVIAGVEKAKKGLTPEDVHAFTETLRKANEDVEDVVKPMVVAVRAGATPEAAAAVAVAEEKKA